MFKIGRVFISRRLQLILAADELEKELRRLEKMPNSGYYTFLHHEGPAIEHSYNVRERIKYILAHKRTTEVLPRLKNIHFMTNERKAAVADIIRKARVIRGCAKNLRPHICSWDPDYSELKALDRELVKALRPLLPYCSYRNGAIIPRRGLHP